MTTKEEAEWQVAKDLLDRHWPINKVTAVKLLNGKISIENYDRYVKEKSLRNLNGFKDRIKDWLQIEDEEVLEVILAGFIGEKVGGRSFVDFLNCSARGN